MKHILAPLLFALALPVAAQADCFVEYKAKKDDPLRLHYGILALNGPCGSADQLTAKTAKRLDKGGWLLLNILGHSQTQPSGNKEAHAGEYFLRY